MRCPFGVAFYYTNRHTFHSGPCRRHISTIYSRLRLHAVNVGAASRASYMFYARDLELRRREMLIYQLDIIKVYSN